MRDFRPGWRASHDFLVPEPLALGMPTHVSAFSPAVVVSPWSVSGRTLLYSTRTRAILFRLRLAILEDL